MNGNLLLLNAFNEIEINMCEELFLRKYKDDYVFENTFQVLFFFVYIEVIHCTK